MLLDPECIHCLIEQIYKAFNLLNPSTPTELIIETQRKLMEYLSKDGILKLPGPIIGRITYNLLAEALGDSDPYKELKRTYNKIAMKYYDQAKERMKKSNDPLLEAVVFAALGNTIDFGTSHGLDLAHDIESFSAENLVINDIEEFRKALPRTKNLLILGDNAGEIVFDKLLIETLKSLYPPLRIVYSVRSGPIINDSTMEDAEFVGITRLVNVVESPDTPGIELSVASDEFKREFYENGGLILTKGQGNFESLYKLDVPNKEVFYLLKAKCILMERIFSVKIGALIFKKKVKGF